MTKTLLLSLLFTGALAAQTESPTFAAARLAETEQDLPRAARLYAKIAESKRPAADRSRAWLALADVHIKLGDPKNAKAAMEQAARGQGPAADEARRRQQGGAADGEGQVLDLIVKLHQGEDVGAQLVWLGRVSVEPLVVWMGREPVKLDFVTSGTSVLHQIGGPEVVAWLAEVPSDYSPLKQRAVLRGLGHVQSKEVLDALRGFTQSDDARVVLDAMRFPPAFTRARVLDLMTSDNAALREGAYQLMANWRDLAGPNTIESRRVALQRVPPLIEEFGMDRTRFSMFCIQGTSEYRELYLDTLAAGIGAAMRLGKQTTIGVDEHAGKIVEVARKLGAVGESSSMPQRRLADFAEDCMARWTRDSLDEVIELLELGYFRFSSQDAEGFVARNASEGDWPRIFRSLSRFSDARWVASLDAKPTVGEFEPLKTEFLRLVQTPIPSNLTGNLGAIGSRIAWIRDETAITWLGRYMANDYWTSTAVRTGLLPDDKLFESIVDAMAKDSNAKSEHIEGLRAIARCEKNHGRARRAKLNARFRLAFLGDDDSAAFTAAIYAGDPEAAASEGLISLLMSHYPNSTQVTGPHSTMVRNGGRQTDRPVVPTSTMVRLVDACLTTRSPFVWDQLFGSPRSARPLGGAPKEVLAVILRYIDQAPQQGRADRFRRLLGRDDLPGGADAIRRFVASKDQEMRSVAVDYAPRYFEGAELDALARPLLGDEEVFIVTDAIQYVAECRQPGWVEALRPLTEHESWRVRRELLQEVPSEQAVEFALLMKGEQHSQVLGEICAVASATLDRRLVPQLIQLLPQQSTRQQAQKALDDIRYYQEEKMRWERILSGSDLTATSAAEALVAQARQKDDRKVRLAAIQSLGTLGVAETLPVLIELMRDADADVAAAAQAAVTKINAASTPQRQGK